MRLSALLTLLAIPLFGEFTLNTETNAIRYLLPEDSPMEETCVSHLMGNDGRIWQVKSSAMKFDRLKEKQSIEVWNGGHHHNDLLIQKERNLILTCEYVAQVKKPAKPIQACGELAHSWNYVMVEDKLYHTVPKYYTPEIDLDDLEEDEEETESVPSISAGWYLGDQVMVGFDEYGWSHLVNRDLREVAEALPPERTTDLRVIKADAPKFKLSDGHEWTVFPNFFFESDIWQKGEKLKGLKTTADKWLYFIPGEEQKLHAINFLLGDPGWTTTKGKRVFIGFAMDTNDLVALWR